jgi:RNA polymerase sigma-70 factor (ECF subfamily)
MSYLHLVNRPDDTSLGGRSPAFPSTLWPMLDRLKKGQESPEAAAEQLVARYWRPVYACVRLGWGRSNEDSKDLTQEFFLFLLEGDALRQADPSRGRFRTYLKTVLRNFLGMEHRKTTRLKRGGGLKAVPFDVDGVDRDLAATRSGDPEHVFDREWARALVSDSLTEVAAALAASGREAHWRLLEAHDLSAAESPAYAELAARFNLTEHQVKAILQETRRRIRDSVILKIKEYALDEKEVWEELEYLMGLWKG